MSAVIINTALAKLLDVGITLALTKLGRDSVVGQVDQWRSEGATEEQILDRLQALAKSTEDAAQGKIDALPPG